VKTRDTAVRVVEGLAGGVRIALTSDIHVDMAGPAVTEALCAQLRRLVPDVAIVAGDVATPVPMWRETMEALRACVPRLVVVAGNHDVWRTPEEAEAQVGSWDKLDRYLPEAARAAGVDLLDAGPVEIDGVGFVGTMGWFDYSTRDPLLDADLEAYRTGRWRGLRWNDHRHAAWRRPDGTPQQDGEVAAVLRDRLRAQLRDTRARRVVAVTHVLPFAEQVVQRPLEGWQYANAFMGCLGLGEVLRGAPRLVLAVAGHTHRGSDLRIGRLRARVSPLGHPREWRGDTPSEAVANAVSVLDV
jgi:hypothetical protein